MWVRHPGPAQRRLRRISTAPNKNILVFNWGPTVLAPKSGLSIIFSVFFVSTGGGAFLLFLFRRNGV